MTRILTSAILSGIMIAIGTIAYLNTHPIVGAVIFAIGLLTILYLKTDLFTGKVPYIKSYKELPYIITVLIGNLIGCCLMFVFPNVNATTMILNKMSDSYIVIFVEAMLCNILIYVAVETFKHNDIISTILAVTVFIVAGFEHSIASMCLIISSRLFTIDSLLYMLTVVVGNAVGGILFHRLREMISK